MSVTFQNADSIKQALYEELQNILSPNTGVRQAAEEHIKQLEYTEGYGVYLAEFTMNQSFDLGLRQLASVMLKKYVEMHWVEKEEDVMKLVATDQAKKMIKNILPNGLYDPNSKIRTSVAYSISTIASWDWPDNWNELFDIIVKCLGGNENSIHGAMQVLVEFTYELNTQISDVGPIILSEVYRIFEAETVYSVKTRSSAVQIFKSLLKSINTHITSKQEQATIINPILPRFMEKLINGLTDNVSSNFTLKSEIIKVLAYMVTDMPKFIHQYIQQILPPIWQVLTQTADIYVKVTVNETEQNPFVDAGDTSVEEDDDFQVMILQLFEFISSIIESRKFKANIKNVLTDLIYIMIVYMQITQEQIDSWGENVEKFVEDEDEDGSDFSIRVSGQDVLMNLGQEFETKFLLALSDALSRHVNVAEAEKTAGNPNWWKIHESCMLAVGSFSNLILEKKDNFNLLQYLNLVRSLMDYQLSPFLSGRCLWALTRFVQSELFNLQMLSEILDATHASVSQDKPLVLRITAMRAIYGFCDNLKDASDDRRSLVSSKLEGFLEGIMQVVNQCKNTVLGLVLETLSVVVSFDTNFTASVQSKVIPLTIAIFLKYHDDPYILELVQDLLKIFSQNPYCLQPLQDRIIPTLVSILNLQGNQANFSMQEIALDVLQTLVKYSTPPLSAALIETAFPATVQCVLGTDDHSVMQSGGECLRAFIAVSPEQVCTFKNGEGLNYIMQVTTMLLNPMNTEFTAVFIGRLVITIIIKAGNLLGDNIDLLLKAVISKMQLVEALNVIMSLVTTFAHLILTQMDAVLNFLSTVPGPTGEPAMTFIFMNWLTRQHMFYGAYERKVTIMALCKLFEYGITTQDPRLNSVMIREPVNMPSNKITTRSQTASSQAQQQWMSVPILVKIFKLLLNELSNLKEANTDANDEWTDDEEDEDGEDNDDGADNENGLNSSISPEKKSLKMADLLYDDDEDENDKMMLELMQDINFGSANMEENLVNFLRTFSRDEHFGAFFEQLTDNEKQLLQSIQVSLH